MAESLHLATFPLHGRRLIEASAGTGKTFTIASLYLRLLLGHGEEAHAHPQPLTVEQILVVTFTDAATAELRDRIRKRIREARLAFIRGSSQDGFITQLMAETEDKTVAIRQLDHAEKQMDEAAVFTIHGFCLRMLQEHAFASGSLFDMSLSADSSVLLKEAAADFWRRHISHQPLPIARLIRAWFNSPEALLQALSPCFSRHGLTLLPKVSGSLPVQSEAVATLIEELRQLWQQQGGDIIAELEQAGFKGNIIRPATLQKHIKGMQRFAQGAPLDLQALDYINSEKFAGSMKKGAEAPDHPAFMQAAELSEYVSTLRYLLLQEAREDIIAGLERAKARAGEITFDDLLTRLASALAQDLDGGLATAIRERFRLAMIDEFQDTDPIQYQIFDTIYPAESGAGLLMIGDPKQAIYAFRGADIFTYLDARESTTAHYNLSTNWRSTRGLIEATNTLFERAPSGFMVEHIDFTSVAAAGKADNHPLRIEGASVAPLQFWLHDGESRSKDEYQQVQARATASHINQLLQLAQQGRAHLGERSLHAGDFAILVRTGREATLIRAELARQGVRSVYLSNRDSVFNTCEADDLRLLLEAVVEPSDERRVRAALASPLFAWSLPQLDRLNTDELALEQALGLFHEWQRLWLKRGVKPMLRHILVDQGIAARLLLDGERRLTDLLHLGELLQQAAQQVRGPHGLIRWLSSRIDGAEHQDEAQLRLESDSDLVKVVTIHKSKGLEYPLVWLPFAVSGRKARKALYHQDDDLILDLSRSKDGVELADDERLEEDLRLIYVALTRAAHACFVGLYRGAKDRRGNQLTLSDTAMGSLLQGPGIKQDTGLDSAMDGLTGHSPHIQVVPPPELNLAPFVASKNDHMPLQARSFAGAIETDWSITSYSRLTGSGHGGWQSPLLDLEDPGDSSSETVGQQADGFSFPRGARYGTLLHGVLEEIDFHDPNYDDVVPAICKRLGFGEEWQEEWGGALQTLVGNTLTTPMGEENIQLAQVPPGDRLVELEFLLPLQRLNAQPLNQLLGTKLGEAELKALDFKPVQGMLTGFIDLVFKAGERYYVLDYKSNYLGDSFADYGPEPLEKAMAEHRYDLQSLIYLLALHRFLQSRLPDYDYERHIGGALYLFLRGLDGQSGDTGVWFTRPEQSFIEAMNQQMSTEPDIY